MKHAIMIMAHKNFEFLHHLIEYFTRDGYSPASLSMPACSGGDGNSLMQATTIREKGSEDCQVNYAKESPIDTLPLKGFISTKDLRLEGELLSVQSTDKDLYQINY